MASKIVKSVLSVSQKVLPTTTKPLINTYNTSIQSRPYAGLPFGSTRPVESPGQILLLAGFATLAFGAKYYVKGYQAYDAAIAKKAEEDFMQHGTLSEFYKNKRFYAGGFDDVMTPKEAALILGCRESACKEQIMERYRTLILQNHPDMGGSPYIAAKINDAKTLLHTNARSDPAYAKKKLEKEKRAQRRKQADDETKEE